MHKVALVIYSKLEGAGNSAIYRALMFAQELARAGDDVVLVFDGAGSTAAAELSQADHSCTACSTAFANTCAVCAATAPSPTACSMRSRPQACRCWKTTAGTPACAPFSSKGGRW